MLNIVISNVIEKTKKKVLHKIFMKSFPVLPVIDDDVPRRREIDGIIPRVGEGGLGLIMIERRKKKQQLSLFVFFHLTSTIRLQIVRVRYGSYCAGWVWGNSNGPNLSCLLYEFHEPEINIQEQQTTKKQQGLPMSPSLSPRDRKCQRICGGLI